MFKNSYEAHHFEYSQDDAYTRILKYHQHTKETRAEFNPDCPLGIVLRENPQLQVGVDIGAGTGWATEVMSRSLSTVYAIEPSDSAVTIGKQILKECLNVVWVNDFAADGLSSVVLNKPCLFNSLVVLSHLDNPTVSEILNKIHEIAPVGSVLSFAECYGINWTDGHLWHVRSQEWWMSHFPGWEFSFYDFSISNPTGAKKSFSAIRIK